MKRVITDLRCREILLEVVEEKTKGWGKRPKFDIVYNSLRYAIVASVGKERHIQVASFRREELSKYASGHTYSLDSKVEIGLAQLQRILYKT